MQKDQPSIPIVKCGKYKQSLMEVQKWQVDQRKQQTPLFQLLHWVIGD